jgi:hypothetical protein
MTEKLKHTVDWLGFSLVVGFHSICFSTGAFLVVCILRETDWTNWIWIALTLGSTAFIGMFLLFFLSFLIPHLSWLNIRAVWIDSDNLVLDRRIGKPIIYPLADVDSLLHHEGAIYVGVGDREWTLPCFVRNNAELANALQIAHLRIHTDNGRRWPARELVSHVLVLRESGFGYTRPPLAFAVSPEVNVNWDQIESAKIQYDDEQRPGFIMFHLKGDKNQNSIGMDTSKVPNVHVLVFILTHRQLLIPE